MKTGWKKALKIVLCVLLILVLAVGGYVAYVFLTYYRLEDNLPLAVEAVGNNADCELILGESYRVVSYNVGFGAYSDDYSFFMDGGTESRARSAEAVRDYTIELLLYARSEEERTELTERLRQELNKK